MDMPLRMAEYALRIYRLNKRFPEQYVLYVGNDPLRMPAELKGPKFSCKFDIVDIRQLDEEVLLASPFDADNILAILTRHKDRIETIRRILTRIATLEGGTRHTAFKKLMILAGLRKLADTVRTEVRHMPILDDIMDHDVLGPTFREGQQLGRQEGELSILRRMIGKRFGNLPSWAEDRLANSSIAELEDLFYAPVRCQKHRRVVPQLSTDRKARNLKSRAFLQKTNRLLQRQFAVLIFLLGIRDNRRSRHLIAFLHAH